MKIKKDILFIAIIICNLFFLTNAQSQSPPPIEWVFTHNELTSNGVDSAEDWAQRIIKTSDGNYLIAGYTSENKYPGLIKTPSLFKITPKGELLWHQRYNHSETSKSGSFNDVIEVDDGYIAVGQKKHKDVSNTEVAYVIRVDFDGDIIGSPHYINTLNGSTILASTGGCIRRIPNSTASINELLIAGSLNGRASVFKIELSTSTHDNTQNFNPSSTDIYSSNTLSSRYMWMDLITLSGGGYAFVATGQGIPQWQVDLDLLLVYQSLVTSNDRWEITRSPNNILNYTPPSTSLQCSLTNTTYMYRDRGVYVKVIGSYVYVGGLFNYNEFGSWSCNANNAIGDNWWATADGVFLKFDLADGDDVSALSLGRFAGGDFQPKFRLDPDDNAFIIAGSRGYSINIGGTNTWYSEFLLTKVSSSGSILWQKGIVSPYDETVCGFDVELTDDNGYIICGDNKANRHDYVVFKLANECYAGLNPSIDNFPTVDPSIPTNYIFSGNWVISGTRTFTNCNIKFIDNRQKYDYGGTSTQKSKIIINPGGKLILNNTTIEVYQGTCDNAMWEGIEILGTHNKAQTGLDLAFQGQLELNGSTIKDAHIGVKVGNGQTAADGGGILDVNNNDQTKGTSYLTNCRVGVQFDYYLDGTNDNQSVINNCVFNCTKQLFGYYGEGLDKHINLYAVRNVKVTNCSLKNDGALSPGYVCDKRGTGIYALNAPIEINSLPGTTFDPLDGCYDFDVTQPRNYFYNLDKGIYAEKTTGFNPNIIIRFGQFYNVKQGITAIDISNPQIVFNYFNFDATLPSNAVSEPPASNQCPVYYHYDGIYLNGCEQFTIKNNRISVASSITSKMYDIRDIWIKNSGFSTLNTSKIYWNEFKNASPYIPNLTPPASYGVTTTGIYVEDVGDETKRIDIYGNGNPSGTNTILNNKYDFYINDQGFSKTPYYSGSGTQYGANNDFCTHSPAPTGYTIKQIHSVHTFTYYYNNALLKPNKPGEAGYGGNANDGVINNNLSPVDENYCFSSSGPNIIPSKPFEVKEDKIENQVENKDGILTMEYANIFELKIYPNPFTNTATIQYNLPKNYLNSSIIIYDMVGRKIKTENLNTGHNSIKLNKNDFPNGLFTYIVINNNELIHRGVFITQ